MLVRAATVAIALTAVSVAIAPADQRTAPTGLVQSFDVFRQRHRVDFGFSVRRTDAGLPAPLNRLVVGFPPGTRFDPWRFPECRLGRLLTRGASGCPRASRVGSGTSIGSDPSLFPQTVDAQVKVFNGERRSSGLSRARRQLLIFIAPAKGPSFVLPGRWKGSRRKGLRLELAVPPTAIEFPPPSSLTGLSFHIGKRDRGASFLRAPCPSTWNATGNYGDGSVVTTPDRIGCLDPPIPVPAGQ